MRWALLLTAGMLTIVCLWGFPFAHEPPHTGESDEPADARGNGLLVGVGAPSLARMPDWESTWVAPDTVSVRVVGSDGMPIEGMLGVAEDLDLGVVRSTGTSDATGQITIARLTAGARYRVWVGLEDETYCRGWMDLCAGSTETIVVARPRRKLIGRVLDWAGTPVAGASARLLAPNWPRARHAAELTDASGRWEFDEADAERGWVRADAKDLRIVTDGVPYFVESRAQVPVSAEPDLGLVELSLEPRLSRLRLRIVDGGGAAIGGSTVRVFGARTERGEAEPCTDELGACDLILHEYQGWECLVEIEVAAGTTVRFPVRSIGHSDSDRATIVIKRHAIRIRPRGPPVDAGSLARVRVGLYAPRSIQLREYDLLRWEGPLSHEMRWELLLADCARVGFARIGGEQFLPCGIEAWDLRTVGDVELAPATNGSWISGSCVRPDGQPAAGARIGKRIWEKCDADGAFRVPVSADTQQLDIAAVGVGWARIALDTKRGRELSVGTVRLQPPRRAALIVRTNDGEIVRGAAVESGHASTSTDARGRAVIPVYGDRADVRLTCNGSGTTHGVVRAGTVAIISMNAPAVVIVAVGADAPPSEISVLDAAGRTVSQELRWSRKLGEYVFADIPAGRVDILQASHWGGTVSRRQITIRPHEVRRVVIE